MSALNLSIKTIGRLKKGLFEKRVIMIYVTSDIHGNYEKYIRIFEKIKFKDGDTLFVLGDAIDRGEDSVKVLLDMSYRFNVIPIMGNHEYMALTVLSKLAEGLTPEELKSEDAEFKSIMSTWFENGGLKTLAEFNELPEEDKESLLEYLQEFSLYEEVTVSDKQYVLVHAGLANFDKDRDLDDYTPEELIWESPDYSKVYFEDKILVTGHTLVFDIEENDFGGDIYKGNNHIAIDCGCGHDDRLGVYCLDNGKEYYI